LEVIASFEGEEVCVSRMPVSGGKIDAGGQISRVLESLFQNEPITNPREFASGLVREFRTNDSPVTIYLIVLCSAWFILQSTLYLIIADPAEGILTLLTTRSSLDGLTAAIFIESPWLAWPFSPFLHGGLYHFAGNIIVLAAIGRRIESLVHRKQYLIWFLAVSLIATPIDAVATLHSSPTPLVAVYGISGFAYSLAFFSFVYTVGLEERSELEDVCMLIGFAAIFEVSIQAGHSIMLLSISPINVGHFVGGISGIFVYYATELDPK
jgi:membrane associated rhomboid family serine protease